MHLFNCESCDLMIEKNDAGYGYIKPGLAVPTKLAEAGVVQGAYESGVCPLCGAEMKKLAPFEIGDVVLVISSGEERTIVGTRSGNVYITQIAKDGSTVKPIKGNDLQLVSRAKQDPDPGFVPRRSIMD